MTKLEKGTPITDVDCPVCGGSVTVVTGAREGDLLKGRCENKLGNGKICASWFTVGTNPSYLLKQDFIKNMMENTGNDNSEEANDNEEDDTESDEENGAISEPETSPEARGDEDAASTGTETGNTKSDRRRRGLFRR